MPYGHWSSICISFVIIGLQRLSVMAHWSVSRHTLSVQNAAARPVFRLCRSDHISRIIVSLHFWLRCTKGLFSRSPCRLIELSMAMMPRSTYTAVHTDRRHPVSTKIAVFFIRRSTRSCCQTAYCWTLRLPCRRRSHKKCIVYMQTTVVMKA